jgi:putative FmdB family regulatory protein
MPLYEYQCEKCAKVAEVLQKMTDPAPVACAFCKKGPMKKIVSRPILRANGIKPEEFKGRDHIAEHNAAAEAARGKGSYVVDDTGHSVEVEADDPRLVEKKIS